MYSDSDIESSPDNSFETDHSNDSSSETSSYFSNRTPSVLSEQEDNDSDEEMDTTQSSNNTDMTEPYDIDENLLNQTPAPQQEQENNIDDSVILINDTQPEILPIDQNEDDDVILIPQNIEIIDLCTQPLIALNNPVNFQNEVIEIVDSPSRQSIPTSRRLSSNRMNPYQRNQNQNNLKTSQSTSNINAILALDDSQDLSQTSKRIRINCPICLESVIDRNPQSTSCGHIFCKNCLLSALQNAKKCPMCRKGIGKNGYHNIHLS
ncbi:hypothetical protein PVAND_002888 [Polypedilum vanderplanki]|uniref:RING-type domain-containing protein n=1 Tax=Polypedilum vanderplanki TaxID=319348 RepID=A0A9J6BTI3_POLVA|nr:hypothetical protein PVAND_002888 [Polypedilum vanderplanki]